MLAANRSPPMCETSQVCSGCAASSAAATGRPRSAQQASCLPWVQTQNSEPSVGARPMDRPRPRAARSRSSTSWTSVNAAGLQPRRDRVGVRREDPDARRSPERSGRRISRTRTPAACADSEQVVAEPVGQPGVAERVGAPRRRCARRAGTRARSTRCRRAARRAAGWRRRSGSRRRDRAGSRHDLQQALADQPPAQHQPALLVEVSARSAGRSSGRAPDLVEGRLAASAGTSRARSPSSTSSRSPRRSSTHGWPGRRRSGVVVVEVARAGSRRRGRRRSRGVRPVRKRRTSSSTAARASMPRIRSASAASRSARPSASAAGSSR